MSFDIPADEHARVAHQQREYFDALAGRIAAGDPLDDMDRAMASAALRAFAQQIPLTPKRAEGAAPKFPHGDAMLLYWAKRMGPERLSAYAACNALADQYGVSAEAIAQVVKKKGDGARRFFESMGFALPDD